MVKSNGFVFIFLSCLQFSSEAGACETGFNGSICDQQCPYPSYGLNCASKCNCIFKDCHYQYGCNKSREDIHGTIAKRHTTEETINRRGNTKHPQKKACETGFNGSSCDKECPYPSYGLNCASKCNCIYKDCHYQYGCNKSRGDIHGTPAKSTKTEETINRRGNTKQFNTMTTMSFPNETDNRTTCSNVKGRQQTRMSVIVSLTIGLAVLALVLLVLYLYVNTIQVLKVYTSNCDSVSNDSECCSGFTWNHSLGKCISCTIGYIGSNCEFPCRYPSYGRLCQSACDCVDTNCDHIYGCNSSEDENSTTSLYVYTKTPPSRTTETPERISSTEKNSTTPLYVYTKTPPSRTTETPERISSTENYQENLSTERYNLKTDSVTTRIVFSRNYIYSQSHGPENDISTNTIRSTESKSPYWFS